MTNADAIKWLENLKKDISETTHQSLWHYEQALAEIIDLLVYYKTESNNCLYYPCAVWDEMAFTREKNK